MWTWIIFRTAGRSVSVLWIGPEPGSCIGLEPSHIVPSRPVKPAIRTIRRQWMIWKFTYMAYKVKCINEPLFFKIHKTIMIELGVFFVMLWF